MIEDFESIFHYAGCLQLVKIKEFERVIMQKLFELQPCGLTCVVTLTTSNALIGTILVELKVMSATRFSYFG